MPENTPITDAELAELRRLHAAATPGEWQAQTYSNYAGWSVWAPDGAGCIAERWYSTGTQDEIPRNDLWIVAAKNAFPGILARLEAAERERDAMHAALSDIYWRSIPLGEDSGHSTISHIAADAMRGKNGNPLAARDAQQRREGAAEWLGGYLQGLSAGKPGAPGSMVAILEAELRRLREGGE